MKKTLWLFMLLFPAVITYSQEGHDVISAAGNFATAGGISLSWTLGETVIPTQQNGDVILTHGFQQQLVVSTLEKNLALEVEVLVYPNPASDVLNLKFGTPVSERLEIIILDQNGRIVKSLFAEPLVTISEINMQDLASGIYYIRLLKGKLSNVYKVVKL
ncbi:MAG: T9SS type A sorting domain-containing protein [Bacteroidales bacterium]|jgi:hypothetical protein|nr:T9SS type A sorting domain-containing protein [Bacteroidales bacterium]